MSEKKQANIVVKHIKSEYGANPEFLWPDRYPGYAVFRHDNNKKWFALVATISSKSLGLKEDKAIDVINLNQAQLMQDISLLHPLANLAKMYWNIFWIKFCSTNIAFVVFR